jgi:hypothetical protein
MIIMKHNTYPILIAIFFLVAIVGCAEKPEQAYKKIIEAAEAEDYGYIYERLDKKSQENYDIRLRHLAQFKISLETDHINKIVEEEKLKSTSNEELFIRFGNNIVKMDSILKPGPYKVIGTQVESDYAILDIKLLGKNRIAIVRMIKENSTWKLTTEPKQPATAE